MPGFPTDQQRLEAWGWGGGPRAGCRPGPGLDGHLGPCSRRSESALLGRVLPGFKGEGTPATRWGGGGRSGGAVGGAAGAQAASPGCGRVTECKAACVHGCVCPWGHPGRTPYPRAWVCSPVKQASPRGARAACARGQPARPPLPGLLLPCSDPVPGPPASSSTPCGAWVPTAGLQPCPRSRPRAPAEPPTAGSGSSSVEGAVDPATPCG